MPSNPPPLVSIVIPTYNRAHCLGRAIRSVLAQNYAPLELIVVDDASTDDTAAVVASFDDPRLSCIRHEVNRGAGGARNTGMAQAKGEFIAFQDSDDEWLLDKLEDQVAALSRQPGDYGAVFSAKIRYGRDAGGRYGDRLASCIPSATQDGLTDGISRTLLKGNVISPQTLLLRRELAGRIGGFDERLPCNEDWDFMLRLARETKVLYLNKPVVVNFISPDSISRNRRGNIFSLLVILRKLPEAFRGDREIYSRHFFDLGRAMALAGKPASGRKLIVRAIRMRPWKVLYWLGFLWVLARGALKPVA